MYFGNGEDVKKTYSMKSLFDSPMGFISAVIEPPVIKTKVCGNCGYDFKDFLETGFLGCSKCYDSFAEELAPYIAQIARGE